MPLCLLSNLNNCQNDYNDNGISAAKCRVNEKNKKSSYISIKNALRCGVFALALTSAPMPSYVNGAFTAQYAAQAQETSQAQIAQVQKIAEKVMNQFFPTHISQAYNLDYQFTPAIAASDALSDNLYDITDKGGYFAVKAPHANILMDLEKIAPISSAAQDCDILSSIRLDMGSIAMNIAPGDQDGRWKITLALPKPMHIYTINKKTGAEEKVADISFGSQRFAGLFDERSNLFYLADGQISSIAVTPHNSKTNISIENIQFSQNYNASNGELLYTGPSQFNIIGIKAFGTNKKNTKSISFKIGEIGYTSRVDSLNPEKLAKYYDFAHAFFKGMDDLVAYSASLEDAREDSGIDNPDLTQTSMQGLENIKKLSSSYINMMKASFDMAQSMSAAYAIKDVSLSIKPTAKAEAADQKEIGFSVENLSLFGGIENKTYGAGTNTSPLIDTHVKYSLSGITLPFLPDDGKDLIPQDISFSLSFNDLPTDEILNLANSLAQTYSDTSIAAVKAGDKNAFGQTQQQQLFMQFALSLPQILSKYKSRIAINDTYIKAPSYSLTLDGHAVANERSPFKSTGALEIVLKGVNKIIAGAQKQARSEDPLQAQRAQQLIQMLSIAQAFGHPSKDGDPDGKSFRFEVNEQGQITLNGTDLQALFGAGGR